MFYASTRNLAAGLFFYFISRAPFLSSEFAREKTRLRYPYAPLTAVERDKATKICGQEAHTGIRKKLRMCEISFLKPDSTSFIASKCVVGSLM